MVRRSHIRSNSSKKKEVLVTKQRPHSHILDSLFANMEEEQMKPEGSVTPDQCCRTQIIISGSRPMLYDVMVVVSKEADLATDGVRDALPAMFDKLLKQTVEKC
ncbi:hypothetical protein V6N13_145955 [Hibiscus sabdariffa]